MDCRPSHLVPPSPLAAANPSVHQPRTCPLRRALHLCPAFTLVELLVVIGIIAVLISILLPTLARARLQAKQLVETSAARQLITAYQQYTNDNHGALIVGYINPPTPDPSPIVINDDSGKPITGLPANRWPWRLLASTKYTLNGVILTGQQADTLSNHDQTLWQYFVSLNPSLGLNFYSLGGEYVAQTNTAYPPSAAKRASQVAHSSDIIVFASAHGDGTGEGGALKAEGYFKIIPPNADLHSTSPSANYVPWVSAPFSGNQPEVNWGYVHPRWRGKAVVACFDGHAEALTLDQLRDMRRWSPAAAKAGNPTYPLTN